MDIKRTMSSKRTMATKRSMPRLPSGLCRPRLPNDPCRLWLPSGHGAQATRHRRLPNGILNGVKDLVIKVASISLPIFTILAAKFLRELVLEDCSLMHVSLSSGVGVASCNSLGKLSLNKVSLDENMFQTLLNNCPLIVSFIFEYCSGLKKIELLNLQNIKSVSISTRTIFVKIRAPTLDHLSYSGYLSDNLDVECPNLKLLDLSYMWTSGEFLQQLISTFESLNVLKIQYGM
ncbi:hypothetical protein CQW23_21009 [Capsicum baccatum]|uniref:F-box/LRR-repeat protein n=1 Tax=Capsicum baccatum TaxID=33114 RepID=A0A2G2VWS5_CAPBA|nr:hypothetical protein CQW23_21009 [Capsicum baccatum]